MATDQKRFHQSAVEEDELELLNVTQQAHTSLSETSHSTTKPFQPTTATLRRPARKFFSLQAIAESAVDLILAIVSICFVVFACLVFFHREQPIDQGWNGALLEASNYGPTIFPILFTAIVAKFVQYVAASKLEAGAEVMTLEYLLKSRSVFSAFTAPVALKTVNWLTPLLFLLWALSPLGGQAALRVISPAPLHSNATSNFTYLAFVSPFTNDGVGSPSAGLLAPINAVFTAALVGSTADKASPQDDYGNVKIPMLEYLHSEADNSGWKPVPEPKDTVWSSIHGLPVQGLPSNGTARFTLNTAYMLANCSVSGYAQQDRTRQSLMKYTGWSGANFAIDTNGTNPYYPLSFVFRSIDSLSNAVTDPSPQPLTVANCVVNMRYVEVQVNCTAPDCRSIAMRPAQTPSTHDTLDLGKSLGVAGYTPLNGLGQKDIKYLSFFPNLVNATNPTLSCDTVFCSPSALEGYLMNPGNPFDVDTVSTVWSIGSELVSQRFTQLINTYWIDSIAPLAVGQRNTNLTANVTGSSAQYNLDSSIGDIRSAVNVIQCHYVWLVMLLIASLSLFACGIAAVILNMQRKGPDILDKFSSLLRDNPYTDIPHLSSMEDGFDLSKRLSKSKVRLGDVQPEDEVGYVALALLNQEKVIQKLRERRPYA